MTPTDVPLWEAIDEIRTTDPRYLREAYLFVVASLGITVQGLPSERLNDPERRHLSGQELLRGMVRIARHEFGPMAATVFREWGLARGEDVGNVVFHLVRRGQLSARPEDTIEDFRGDLDLQAALASDKDPFAEPRGGSQSPRSGRKTGPELEA